MNEGPRIPEAIRRALAEGETGDRFLVEGRHAVRALLQTGRFPVEALVTTGTGDAELHTMAAEQEVPVHEISREEASGILGFAFHRGVLAVAKKPVADVAAWFRESNPSRLVLLEGLADPGNVGTIIRNVVAFNFEGVITIGGGASPFNAKAVRASATAIFQVPVFSEEEFPPCLADAVLVGADLSPEAMDLDGLRRMGETETAPLVVALGREADGLSEKLLGACRYRVRIPISPRVESLNVASASAILLHALGG